MLTLTEAMNRRYQDLVRQGYNPQRAYSKCIEELLARWAVTSINSGADVTETLNEAEGIIDTLSCKKQEVD